MGKTAMSDLSAFLPILMTFYKFQFLGYKFFATVLEPGWYKDLLLETGIGDAEEQLIDEEKKE